MTGISDIYECPKIWVLLLYGNMGPVEHTENDDQVLGFGNQMESVMVVPVSTPI